MPVADYQIMLRELPAVDRLLNEPAVAETMQDLPRRIVLQAVQETIDSYRKLINANRADQQLLTGLNISPAGLASEAVALAFKKARPNIGPVINASGVVIHTNLGRSPLAPAAVDALADLAANFNNLELNLDTGKRGSRQDHLEEIICDLTGAEAAAVFNNNAAAVFLVLNTLTSGLEVIVSRGELVEIGGSFRIPEIMASSGARMIEVGTTNKTYRRDYEKVINDRSAALLKVHTSNYQMVGFTAAVNAAELAELAHDRGLIMIEDLGSGVLIETSKYGLPAEPRVQDSIEAGADLVTFSGDKMLGGPQAGIVVGRKELVGKIKANQMARVVRVDKFTVAALEATLRLYYEEETALREIPVWRMLTANLKYLQQRAEKLAQRIGNIFGTGNVSIIPGISRVGGGAMPNAELPTALVAVRLNRGQITPDQLAERLRRGTPPVILRLQQDSLLFDPRTIFEEQEDALVEALQKALNL